MNGQDKEKSLLKTESVKLGRQTVEMEESEAERKRTEKELLFFSSIVEQSNLGIASTDLEGYLLSVNSAFAAMHGYSPDELIGKHLSLFHTSDQMPSVEAANRRLQETGEFKGEIWHVRRDRRVFPALMHNSLLRDEVGTPIGMIVTLQDITASKLAEEELQESEQRYSSLFKNNHAVMLLIDPESAEIVDANPAACSFYGWSQEQLTNMKITDINMLPDEQVFQEIERAKSEERHHFFFRHRLANEKIRDVEVYSGPIRLHGKELLYSIIHDISERKRVEEALRREKDRARRYLDTAGVIMLALNAGERVELINMKGCEILGYDEKEIVGENWFDIFIPERLRENLRVYFERLLAGESEPAEYYQNPILTKNGEERIIAWHNTVLKNDEGDIIATLSSGEDITEREQAEEEKKKLEGQLLQTKKLEAISTLSGGVAQELGNLFQAVHGYVERLMWGKEQDDPKYQELLEITNAAFRGAVLSKRLLAFSGIIESKKQPIDLNQEVKKVHKLLRRTMPETIELELHLANEITIINGNPNQIEQALLALAVNARDAMQGGGKIFIETRRMILDDNFLRTHTGATMGECALITISDTGPGLGQKTLEHVFDPFYSKEDSSEKKGLGLSMVYGIVKNHGGYISCSSEPNRGTTFQIYLPVVKEEAK